MGKVLTRLAYRSRKKGSRAVSEKSSGVSVPEHLDWMIWRLIVERITTLKEVETYYDLVDVLDANMSLDLMHEAEEKRMKDVENKI